jgi:hypothetical protein
MKFDLKNRIDLFLLISLIILFLTGAFLRFFKYFFSPDMTEKLTLLLIPEIILVLIIFAIKIWR